MIESPQKVPESIRQREQWVCWKTQIRDGETKVPVDPTDGTFASTRDPSTWSSFRAALEFATKDAETDGVGFVFTEEDPFVGVDLDKCRNPESETFDEWALKVIETLKSYSEVSPSGTGAHVLIKGTIPGEKNRRGSVEIYETGRYFTVTGALLDGEHQHERIHNRESELRVVYSEYIDDQSDSSSDTETRTEWSSQAADSVDPIAQTGLPDADKALLEVAWSAKNREKFRALWRGDWTGRYKSQSEADQALANILAFYTQKDPARMDRMFRASGLYREKWDADRGDSTYGELTIREALKHIGDDETYSGTLADTDSTESEGESKGESGSDTIHNGTTSGHTDSAGIRSSEATTGSNRPSGDRRASDERGGVNGSHTDAGGGSENGDHTTPLEADRREPTVRSSPGGDQDVASGDAPDVRVGVEPDTTTRDAGSAHRTGSRDGSGTAGVPISGMSAPAEDWRGRLLDYDGRVPPWVNQLVQRVEELEGEVDRNEQLIQHWQEQAKQTQSDVQRLQQQVEALTHALTQEQRGGTAQFDSEALDIIDTDDEDDADASSGSSLLDIFRR